MISIIVPVYKEPFVNKTLMSLLMNSEKEVEILPIIDGCDLSEPLIEHKNIRVITHYKNLGMRACINTGVENAKGDLIMKIDAHCVVAKGYDTVLSGMVEDNWLVIPRRYSLNFNKWERDEKKKYSDYHYINFPVYTHYGWYMGPHVWQKEGPVVDDTMSFQGSCWVANKKYFKEHIYPLDDRRETYGTFSQDQQEIGLKYWLGGGAIKVNKYVWYAHLSKRGYHYDKGLFSRRYKKNRHTASQNNYGLKHWITDSEPNMIHPFSWLIHKFWPVPDWPIDWLDQLKRIPL